MKTFDELSELYRTNVEEFEIYRNQLIDEMINSAPEEHQTKLKQIQWKLNGIHKTKNGLAATIQISKLMWESFYDLKEKLEELQSSINALGVKEKTKPVLKVIK
jgi:hypothetical protein